jgi:hypothetical protein
MMDIVGTLRFADDLDDAELQPHLAGVPLANATAVQPRARTLYGKTARYAATADRLFDPPVSVAQREALFAARRSLMRAEPGAYVAHRWRQLYRLLGFGKTRPSSAAYTRFVAVPEHYKALQHGARHSQLQATLIRPVQWLSKTFVFQPYLYLILAIMLLPLAAVRRHREATLLLASGVLHELSLMFVTTRIEYRYSHWMIAATVLAIILLVAHGRASTRERGAVAVPSTG